MPSTEEANPAKLELSSAQALDVTKLQFSHSVSILFFYFETEFLWELVLELTL